VNSWKLQSIKKGHPKSLRAIQKSIQLGNWKVDELPPEGMIQYYGQGIWAEANSWSYWIPIYLYIYVGRDRDVDIIRDRDRDMLNSII
jgi:hypothetical protein